MNIEKIKAGKPIWVRGYADGVGNIDFLDRERNIDELECLIKDDIFYMSESDFRLDEPEIIDKFEVDQPKPAVPQFVAEWYEKHNGYLDGAIKELAYYTCTRKFYTEIEKWFDNTEKPIQTLINMHQFGYTVKKEKLFTVEIPDPNSKDRVYCLFKDKDGQVKIGYILFSETEPDESWRYDPDMHLTEQEIKKGFEWALKWKKEVV